MILTLIGLSVRNLPPDKWKNIIDSFPFGSVNLDHQIFLGIVQRQISHRWFCHSRNPRKQENTHRKTLTRNEKYSHGERKAQTYVYMVDGVF